MIDFNLIELLQCLTSRKGSHCPQRTGLEDLAETDRNDQESVNDGHSYSLTQSNRFVTRVSASVDKLSLSGDSRSVITQITIASTD
jgi:hypothetical protein